MRLYGLRDEQGRDVELVISDDGRPHHHVLRVDVVEAREYESCPHPEKYWFIDKDGQTRCSDCHKVVE